MDKFKIEAFLSTSHCPNSERLTKLLRGLGQELGEKVETITYQGRNEIFENYNLVSLPAVVVGEIVKIMGFCPSKESLISALKELGME